MSLRRWTAIIFVALGAVLLGTFGTGQAASRAAGQGPDEALPVPDGWQDLNAQTWYAFQYTGDNSDMLVRMSVGPTGSTTFAIWSPTDVDRWRHGFAVDPAGRGSVNNAYGGDLTWTGKSGYGGTWYVVVEPAGATSHSFNLKVSGQGVSSVAAASASPAATTTPLPMSAVTTVQTAPAPSLQAPAATPTPVKGASLAYYNPRTPTPTPAGQYPAQAVALPDGSQTLGVGQHVWYAFRYLGDRSEILIRLHADSAGSAKFTVWSPDMLQRWGERYYERPTGQGTANELYNGDLIWSGHSIIHGTWYIIAEQNGSLPTSYQLEVTGTGVDRTLAPTPVPTPTYSLPIPTPGGYQ